MQSFSLQCFALDEIQLGNVEKKEIEIQKQQTKINGSLLLTDTQIMDELVKLQQSKDLADIEKKRKGTDENNKVIEFALKKLIKQKEYPTRNTFD